MRKEKISNTIGEIDDRHISEAMAYQGPKKRRVFGKGPMRNILVAAVLCICLIAGYEQIGRREKETITVHAYGTNKEISSVGTVLSAGKVNADGSMTGAPLRFYLQGENIKSVRFSVKNEWIDFIDWTETREEYGAAKNFTVPYGDDSTEYKSLVINWEPNKLWEALEGKDIQMVDLAEELREDLIVLQVTFENGETKDKAVRIQLQSDGTFLAFFEDYAVTKEDTFVEREDSQPIGNELLEEPKETPNVSLDEEEIKKAKEAALAYYKDTVLEVVSMEVLNYENSKLTFTVTTKKDGRIQDPDRTIVLRYEDSVWKVENEGY